MGVTICASQFMFDDTASSMYKLELMTDDDKVSDSKGMTVKPVIIKTTYGDKYRCQGHEIDGSLQFKLKMGTREPISAIEQSRIQHWLFGGSHDFKKLVFVQDDLNGLHFMAKVTEFNIVQVGNLPYLCEVTFECDSYYAYEDEDMDTFNLIGATNTITFDNGSHQNSLMFPKLEFKMRSNGDITIKNITDNGRELKFTSLVQNEIVKVDCYDGFIESSTELNRTKNCISKKLTRFDYGENQLQIIGDVEYIKITYQNARIISM